MRRSGESLHRPETVFGVADHDVPTTDRSAGIADPRSREQVETLARNCAEFGATHFAPDDVRHGITHVIGPERGIALPGMVAVACDSHAVTYGALGAVGFGIGATDVESVFRSNTLIRETPSTLRITLTGRRLNPGVSAKDVILAVIGKIGADGANGHAIEFAGEAVDAMSMESRLTLCNMTVEAGARAGLVAPDEVTFNGSPADLMRRVARIGTPPSPLANPAH